MYLTSSCRGASLWCLPRCVFGNFSPCRCAWNFKELVLNGCSQLNTNFSFVKIWGSHHPNEALPCVISGSRWEWVILSLKKHVQVAGADVWESHWEELIEEHSRAACDFSTREVARRQVPQLPNQLGVLRIFFGKYGSFLLFFRVIQLSRSSFRTKKWLNRCRSLFPVPSHGPTS